MGRKRATPSSAVEKHNAEVRQRHAELIDAIIAIRPQWHRAKLADVGRTYGTPEQPGLHDILTALRQADALDASFSQSARGSAFNRHGDRVTVVTPDDPPRAVVDGGKIFYATGKLGTHTATGVETAEYEADDRSRLWADYSGTIVERNA